MDSADLERLRLLLDGLRGPAPAREAENRAVEAFGRLWKVSDRQSRVWRLGVLAADEGDQEIPKDRRSSEERRKRDRRRRAVLVEKDRRGGLDRRQGDRRRS